MKKKRTVKKEKRTKWKAIFEVEFFQEDMVDDETLKKEYGGSMPSLMAELISVESIGLFDQELRFVGLSPLP